MHTKRILFAASLASVLALSVAPALWADRGDGGGGNFGGGGLAGGGGEGDSGDGGRSGGDSGGSSGNPGGSGGSDRGDKNNGGGGGLADGCCNDDAQEGNDSDARDDYASFVFDGMLDDANSDASE